MHDILVVLIGVAVAAFIGGMTNYLAIKMLFHPRREWRIKGVKVPFTPGLIPKRRDEIARALGRVVAEYLVTSQGIAGLLRRESFRQGIVDKLTGRLQKLAETEQTVMDWLEKYWDEEQREQKREAWLSRAAAALAGWSEQSLRWLWVEQGLSQKRIGDLLSGWDEEEKAALVRKAADYIADSARAQLYTPEGERLLLRMTSQLLEQAGGFLGAMASIFMDEAKVAGKVRQALSDALAGQPVRLALGQFVRRRLEDAERMTLAEMAALIERSAGMRGAGVLATDNPDQEGTIAVGGTGADSGLLLIERVSESLPWRDWLDRGGRLRIDRLAADRMEWLESRIPEFVDFLFQLLERNLDRIFSALRLDNLVDEQIRNFPIERLENIILSISGREFRAITWLGAILGGIIGLVQALLLRLFS